MANRNTLPEGLLDDVKNYLNITWDDEATDQKIGGLIASGMVYLDARYARDSALDVFESNYLSMLLGMQNEKAVKNYEALSSVE